MFLIRDIDLRQSVVRYERRSVENGGSQTVCWSRVRRQRDDLSISGGLRQLRMFVQDDHFSRCDRLSGSFDALFPTRRRGGDIGHTRTSSPADSQDVKRLECGAI